MGGIAREYIDQPSGSGLSLIHISLGKWSQGLLYGLGVSDIVRWAGLSPESQEFLHDATGIAQAGFDRAEATDADETAYTEVVEYLRVGLLLLQLDLNRPTAAHRSRPP